MSKGCKYPKGLEYKHCVYCPDYAGCDSAKPSAEDLRELMAYYERKHNSSVPIL